MYRFEFDASQHRYRELEFPLEPFANLHATEIFWKFDHFDSFAEPTTGATNDHVKIVSLEAQRFALFDTDIDLLLRFFPKLAILNVQVKCSCSMA